MRISCAAEKSNFLLTADLLLVVLGSSYTSRNYWQLYMRESPTVDGVKITWLSCRMNDCCRWCESRTIKFESFSCAISAFNLQMTSTSQICQFPGCSKIAKQVCIKCDNAVYCDNICARADWDGGHKQRCYKWRQPLLITAELWTTTGVLRVEK